MRGSRIFNATGCTRPWRFLFLYSAKWRGSAAYMNSQKKSMRDLLISAGGKGVFLGHENGGSGGRNDAKQTVTAARPINITDSRSRFSPSALSPHPLVWSGGLCASDLPLVFLSHDVTSCHGATIPWPHARSYHPSSCGTYAQDIAMVMHVVFAKNYNSASASLPSILFSSFPCLLLAMGMRREA